MDYLDPDRSAFYGWKKLQKKRKAVLSKNNARIHGEKAVFIWYAPADHERFEFNLFEWIRDIMKVERSF